MSFHSLVIFWLNQRQLCNFIFFLIKPGVVQVSGWPQVLSFLVYTQSVFWSFNREAFSPLNFDGSCPAGGSTSESSTLSVHLQVPADITLLLLQSANRFISLSLLSLRKCGNKCNCTGKKEQIFFFFLPKWKSPNPKVSWKESAVRERVHLYLKKNKNKNQSIHSDQVLCPSLHLHHIGQPFWKSGYTSLWGGKHNITASVCDYGHRSRAKHIWLIA